MVHRHDAVGGVGERRYMSRSSRGDNPFSTENRSGGNSSGIDDWQTSPRVL